MSNRMMFSVIMPVYNVEEYLSEAIESVLNQCYQNFELIIVNDGSTDKSLSIAQKHKEQDSRIRIISQKNRGLSSARNTGLSVAKGEYIYFIDSDDWIVDYTLSRIYSLIKYKEYDMLCFLAEPFVTTFKTKIENETVIQQYKSHYERAYLEEKEYKSTDYQWYMSKNRNFVPSVCLYVFKKNIVVDNNLQFFEGILYEDNLFTRELLTYAKNVYFISKKFYQRRIRHGSITTSKIDERKPYSYLIISEQLFKLSQLKKENGYLISDSQYFFAEALNLINSEFRDSTFLKSVLYKVYRKLNMKIYKFQIIKLKYPFLRILFSLGKKMRNKFRAI